MSVPPGSYKVVVSANLQFTENGAMLPEPLTTRTAYGRWGTDLPLLTGTKMEVAPSITARGSNPYSDNWAESGQMLGWEPPGDGGGDQNDEPDNLAVINLELFRVNEQGEEEPVSGTVEVNKPYKSGHVQLHLRLWRLGPR